MYRSRSSCSSSKVAPSNCAESDTTVPDSPARAEKFAERCFFIVSERYFGLSATKR
ncbi:hypothetical protein HID58_081939 [Brassica napus]|uniref:Uncharacterized protein n=1 Tax=Brassica napus TaxID=3708 RepID=A0ABQ7Y947_BRANA|nr:hypothetical protein HID58_081939 [Brassica napus]